MAMTASTGRCHLAYENTSQIIIHRQISINLTPPKGLMYTMKSVPRPLLVRGASRMPRSSLLCLHVHMATVILAHLGIVRPCERSKAVYKPTCIYFVNPGSQSGWVGLSGEPTHNVLTTYIHFE